MVTDSQGKPDFEAMMGRFQSNHSSQKVQYCVYDVIYHEGIKVTNLPLIERKTLLESFLPQSETVSLVHWIYGNGEAYFNLTKQHDLEGIVLKKANSKYQTNKRSHDWLKVINYQYTDAVITGIRKDEFGLLLGIEEGDRIKPAGLMEFMSLEAKKRFYKEYRSLIVNENDKFVYLDPKLKCRVKFRNYTKAGLLRIPSLLNIFLKSKVHLVFLNRLDGLLYFTFIITPNMKYRCSIWIQLHLPLQLQLFLTFDSFLYST